jgi:hypothetical protein
MLAAPRARDTPVQGDPIAVIPNDLLAAEPTRPHEAMVVAMGLPTNSEADAG